MPTIQNILYATDLSETAKEAMHWAISLGEKYNAAVTIIHVIPDLTEEMSASMGYDLAAHFDAEQLAKFNAEGKSKAKDSITERIQSVCNEMKDELSNCQIDLTNILIKTGHPVEEIISVTDEGDYDMVVMGTHGHSLIDDLLLGSVARGVVHKCKIPVLTIRLPKQ